MSGKAKHPQFTALLNRQGPLYALTNGFLRADIKIFGMMVPIAEHCYQYSVPSMLIVCMNNRCEIFNPFIQDFLIFSE